MAPGSRTWNRERRMDIGPPEGIFPGGGTGRWQWGLAGRECGATGSSERSAFFGGAVSASSAVGAILETPAAGLLDLECGATGSSKRSAFFDGAVSAFSAVAAILAVSAAGASAFAAGAAGCAADPAAVLSSEHAPKGTPACRKVLNDSEIAPVAAGVALCDKAGKGSVLSVFGRITSSANTAAKQLPAAPSELFHSTPKFRGTRRIL